VDGNVGGKDGQGAACQGDRTVGVTTGPSPVHLAETTFESHQKSIVTVPAGQLCEVICDRWQPKRAGAALTGTLLGEVANDAGGLGEAARCLAQSHDHAHSCGGANRAQWDGRVGSSKMFWADPRSPVSPDQERLYSFDGLASLDDVPQRGAFVDLDYTGVGHSTAQCHEAGPGLLSHAASPKRRSAVASDEGDVRQRLSVVHQRWALLYPQGNAFVRAKHWSRAGRLDPVGQRRFFSGDEAVRGLNEFLSYLGVALSPPLLHGLSH
jgi:hypothetical protein